MSGCAGRTSWLGLHRQRTCPSRRPLLNGDSGVFKHHEVKPVPGTLLARITSDAVSVPTCHHQAVDRLGEGLMASAHATADGTVEAVERAGVSSGAGFALGVQGHPGADTGDDVRVMRALVEAAAAARG